MTRAVMPNDNECGYAECHNAKHYYDKCHYAECHNTEHYYAKCLYVVIMQTVAMPTVVMQSDCLLNVLY
jgi:hypothetical protein